MKAAGGGTHRVLTVCGRRISYGVREVTMRVRVRLFATLARYSGNTTPGTFFVMEVPDRTTLLDLVIQLELPREEVKVFFVNGRARPMDWPLIAEDEVGIFPLIAGG